MSNVIISYRSVDNITRQLISITDNSNRNTNALFEQEVLRRDPRRHAQACARAACSPERLMESCDIEYRSALYDIMQSNVI